MKHKETFVVILTVISSSLAFGISSAELQHWSFSIFFSSSSSLLHPAFVFAQSTDEPVLRFSDDIGNPVFNQPGFTAEVVAEGLTLPTTMAFLSQNDILVLEKDKGTVMRVINGEVQPQPLLDVNVATEVERCMCGIAISQNNETGKTNVFLYYTEAEGQDGGTPIANRLYRYEIVSDDRGREGVNNSSGSNSISALPLRLINPQLLLDLPTLPGPRHNGGAISIGPDNSIYIPVGDTDKIEDETEAQNEPDFPADGTSGILRVTQNGEPVVDSATGEYILGNSYPLNLYYAYGIRNSFGIDFDPITGNLWDSENGPGHSDEINLVQPGFNSGWNQVMGIWLRGGGDPREGESTLASEQPEGLVNFGGRGQYHAPQLTWLYTIGPTAIKFLDSDKYGPNYENDLFVGDIHAGNMYHFKLNQLRTELALPEPLNDKIADTEEETFTDTVLFATGFAGISDIEVSPYDGYMYVVSLGQGKIFRILPTGDGEVSVGTVPTTPPAAADVPPATDDENEIDTEEQDLSEQEGEDEDEDTEDDNNNEGNQDENEDE